MRDQRQTKQLVGVILMCTAVVLAVVAGLIYTAVVSVDPEVRMITTAAVGIGAIADLGIGIWYFSMGQSS